MIHSENNKTLINGTPRCITADFTQVIIAFRDTLKKEYSLSSSEIDAIISKCFDISKMTSRDAAEYIINNMMK